MSFTRRAWECLTALRIATPGAVRYTSAVSCHREWPTGARIDVNNHRDAVLARNRGEPLEARTETASIQIRRRDLHDHRPELADRGPGFLRRGLHDGEQLVVRRLGAFRIGQAHRRRAEREADGGEVLHRPVMEIAGDPPALGLGAVDGALQEDGSLWTAPLEFPGEAPAQRDQHG